MSFFSGLLGDHSPFGRNCQEVESDPKADPFEKEICVTMRQFEESFSRFPGFGPPVEFGFEDNENQQEKEDTPQSRRDAILSPDSRNQYSDPSTHDYDQMKKKKRRDDIWQSSPRADQDLDAQVARDPSLLDDILQSDQSPALFKDHKHERKDNSFSSSHSSSVTISTIRRPDGTVEQRKTVRDSDGNEEVTVSHYHENGNSEREEIISRRGPGRGGDGGGSSGGGGGGGLLGMLSDWLSGRN